MALIDNMYAKMSVGTPVRLVVVPERGDNAAKSLNTVTVVHDHNY